jgi:hypothetical protein
MALLGLPAYRTEAGPALAGTINHVARVADGLFWLSQKVERNSVVRKLQILKVRGQGSVPGLHTVRIEAVDV